MAKKKRKTYPNVEETVDPRLPIFRNDSLDCIGHVHGFKRKKNECDNKFLKRICKSMNILLCEHEWDWYDGLFETFRLCSLCGVRWENPYDFDDWY